MIWSTQEQQRFRYEHLEHKSFAELFALKREAERSLHTLRRLEPPARLRSSAAYTLWIGRNVECIDRLNRVHREISRRQERAAEAGVRLFAGRKLLM